MSGPRVLITGATGYLGGHLARALQAQGWPLVLTGRDAAACARLAGQGHAVHRLDLAGGFDPALAARIGAVDAVVHCAALSAPWGRWAAFEAANVTGTATALDLAGALGARRFVNISSPAVGFALRDQIGLREDAPLPPPINAYARSKALAERLVLARGALGPVTLRPRGIYGPGEQTLLPRLAAALRRGPLPLLRGGVAAIDLTHVSDVVGAIQAAVLAGPAVEGQTFHISGGEMAPVREIVARVGAALDLPVRWRPMPLRPLMALARLAEAVTLALPGGREPVVTPYALGLFAFRQSLDLTKARSLLGWRPVMPLSPGLEDALAAARGVAG
ncbi:NAD-dependent epimerase/dehydratase family protein [Pseudogemmobacter blasticus]|uniref:3-beta hydroxysteroid dehydrogenase n=1 Tax=Fuscovulum blasticum DSM 2131 TaxID=1188250 RepID=A0A2T4JDZ0_FUSBL|nr:NAD(P)-dependent oxidoreductase [Fuscovulum blasticum]PTE16106.1 3-beta hydroxysteroid dehydrogenase [Fuscovulum blasticum DSM 2131]